MRSSAGSTARTSSATRSGTTTGLATARARGDRRAGRSSSSVATRRASPGTSIRPDRRRSACDCSQEGIGSAARRDRHARAGRGPRRALRGRRRRSGDLHPPGGREPARAHLRVAASCSPQRVMPPFATRRERRRPRRRSALQPAIGAGPRPASAPVSAPPPIRPSSYVIDERPNSPAHAGRAVRHRPRVSSESSRSIRPVAPCVSRAPRSSPGSSTARTTPTLERRFGSASAQRAMFAGDGARVRAGRRRWVSRARSSTSSTRTGDRCDAGALDDRGCSTGRARARPGAVARSGARRSLPACRLRADCRRDA